MWPKSNKPALDALAESVSRLRSDLDDLRNLCRDLSGECAQLRQERALRETEMADLRTRYEVLIKRVGARLTGPGGEREEPRDTTYDMRRKLGR